MSVILKDTSAGQIASAILKARRNLGTASGLAFTLVVVTDARHYAKVFDAAMEAGREHPSRILVVVRSRTKATGLDAEIHTDGGVPGDVVTLRMGGELDEHADSVVLPLLLPDSPVVVWWPNESPLDPGQDSIGVLATRRITDAGGVTDPVQALLVRAKHHSPGDTDLTWTRLTPWRALLAAALDQFHNHILSAQVESAAANAPAQLLAAWLEDRLHVEVKVVAARGADGISAVRLTSAAGDVVLSRTAGSAMANYVIPGQPPRQVALPRRDINQLITEELRRMDPDDIYEMATQTMLKRDKEGLIPRSRRRRTSSADGEVSGGPATSPQGSPAGRSKRTTAKVVPDSTPGSVQHLVKASDKLDAGTAHRSEAPGGSETAPAQASGTQTGDTKADTAKAETTKARASKSSGKDKSSGKKATDKAGRTKAGGAKAGGTRSGKAKATTTKSAKKGRSASGTSAS